MKPVYFFGTRAKELAKRLHPVTNTRCLDLWTDGAEHTSNVHFDTAPKIGHNVRAP